MAHSVLAAVVLVVAMATGVMADCSTPLTSYEFRQLFCQAHVVFRGTRFQMTSGVFRDHLGRRVESARAWFTVQQSFKGSTPVSSEVTVIHTWREGVDTCPRGAFPDTGPDFLVFATRTSYLTVEDTCRHSFPWDCVNQDFKDQIPNIECPAQH